MRPLLPGMILLGLAWPARQMLITIDRPYRLCLATLAGLALAIPAGGLGARAAGLVGGGWGMSVGYGLVYVFTSATAFGAVLGRFGLVEHYMRLAGCIAWYAAGALIAAHVPLPVRGEWAELAARSAVLAAWILPPLLHWGRKHEWGGLFGSRGRE